MTAANGLYEGDWTIRIQAKRLPYRNLQAFSIVITADGLVTPPSGGSLPTPISPIILQQCAANSAGNLGIYWKLQEDAVQMNAYDDLHVCSNE